MRTLLAAAALAAATIGPSAAQGQTFTLQTWTCTSTTGEVQIYRIGPGDFRVWIRSHNSFASNWCGSRGEGCTYANGQFTYEDDDGMFTINLATGAFVEDSMNGYSTGTCRVTG